MPKPPASPFLAAGALALAVTACGSAAMQPTTPSGTPSGVPEHERPNEIQRDAKPPVPRRNPHAVAYDITLTLHDAPGPFAVVKAGMDYEVANPLCLPRLGGMSGTRVQATQDVPIDLVRIAPNVYRGRFHDDLFVDEDYYGLGVCHWRLTGIGFGLRATGADGETRFGDVIFHDDLVGGRSQRIYFEKHFYPSTEIPDFPATGERDLSKFKPEYRGRDHLFMLEIAVEKAPR